MIEFVGKGGRRTAVFVVYCDSKTCAVTVGYFRNMEEARDAFDQLSGKYRYLISSAEELEAAKMPSVVLMGIRKLNPKLRPLRKFGNRQRIEREVWNTMSAQEKQIAKDEAKGKKADAKQAVESKKTSAAAKKAEVEKQKAEKLKAAQEKKDAAEKVKAEKKAAADAKKAEAAKEKQQREMAKSRISPDEVIMVLTDGNPKREGSEAFKRFALYKNGMRVQQFLDAGGTMADINWDLGHRLISVARES